MLFDFSAEKVTNININVICPTCCIMFCHRLVVASSCVDVRGFFFMGFHIDNSVNKVILLSQIRL